MNCFELHYMLVQRDEVATELLTDMFRRLVWSLTHRMKRINPHVRLDKEDIHQEGLVALNVALWAFRPEFGYTLPAFVQICVQRELGTLLRKYRGKSFGLIDQSLSLDHEISEDEQLYLIDTIENNCHWYDPEPMAHYQESCTRIHRVFTKMEPLDADVMSLRMNGYSYQEVAQRYGLTTKQVDNIVQRVRKRLKAELFDETESL